MEGKFEAHDSERCGVILHPAAHTRSPAMHNAAFKSLGLRARYAAFDVPPEALAQALDGARALGFRQLAVSIPHKETILPLLDEIDEIARAIGAVNTVTRVGERLVGSNTDWLGAVRALERKTPLDGRRAVVLGAGGAARAVVYGLRRAGARVRVLNRDVDRARALVEALGGEGAGALSELGSAPCDVVVNTTSVGLRSDVSPVAAEQLPERGVVMDAVYDPPHTRLLRDAEGRGCQCIGGKWMLVYQAAEQVRLWSQLDAPVEVMAEAFDRCEAR